VRRIAAAAAVALVCLSACAGGPAKALKDTASSLSDVRSGALTYDLAVTGTDGTKMGYRIEGPFALARPGKLPVADVTYTRTTGPTTTEAGLISDGDRAFVVLDGQAYTLPESRLALLRAPSGDEGEGPNPLDALHVDDWVTDPRSAKGDGTVRVTGGLDVATAINDVIDLMSQFGTGPVAGLHPIEDRDRATLERAVKNSSFELVTGSDDHLLRRLVIDVAFAVPQGPGTEDLAKALPGADFRMELAIDGANRPVDVDVPTDALPFEQIGASG
jgi:hypothetical protein